MFQNLIHECAQCVGVRQDVYRIAQILLFYFVCYYLFPHILHDSFMGTGTTKLCETTLKNMDE